MSQGLALGEAAGVLRDRPVAPDLDPVRPGRNLDRLPGRRGVDAALIAVEGHEAGRRRGGLHRPEGFERPPEWRQRTALLRESFKDAPALRLRMPPPGVLKAHGLQPGVDLIERAAPEPRREDQTPDMGHLDLHLPLLPGRPGIAHRRLNKMAAAHRQEPLVPVAIPAPADLPDNRLHVVMDAPPTGAAEERERPVVCVDQHLQALPAAGPHERHPAVAKAEVRHPAFTGDPPTAIVSTLQLNWKASPGSNASGT